MQREQLEDEEYQTKSVGKGVAQGGNSRFDIQGRGGRATSRDKRSTGIRR